MVEQHTNDGQEIRLKLYAETRSDLLKRQLSNSENADRAILSVSTASLGFSLAFLKDIVPLQETTSNWILYLSWAFFVLSIVITLLSFFTSQKAINEQLDLAHRYYLERDDEAAKIRPKAASITEVLNMSGAVLLAVGLLITCIFVGINLLRGINMAEKKHIIGMDGALTPSLQRIPQDNLMTKGATIPSFQTIPTEPQVGAPIPALQNVPPSIPSSTTIPKDK